MFSQNRKKKLEDEDFDKNIFFIKFKSLKLFQIFILISI
jgi:hypothetical protein